MSPSIDCTPPPARRQPPAPPKPGYSGSEEIVYTDQLPEKADNPEYVLHGYAVQTSGWMPLLWRFFRSFEPAYLYGRTSRMGEGVIAWDVHPAAFSSRFVLALDREVITMHIDVGTSLRSRELWGNDRSVVEQFLEGFDPGSGHWTHDS